MFSLSSVIKKISNPVFHNRKNIPQKDQEKINLMIIGVGNHARRIYIPSINRLSRRFNCDLVVGIDIIEAKSTIDQYLVEKNFNLKMYYLEKVNPINSLSDTYKEILNEIVTKNNIKGVIISTDPTTHKIYAEWALSKGLNILTDKPITTQNGVSHDTKKAKALTSDYIELLRHYNNLQKQKSTAFLVNTQRRYEIGYVKVFSLIKEVSDKFNIPVTSIQAMHSDGVWIFPDEIVEQKVHPYSTGYGKLSHSGYHLFDIVWNFYKSGRIKEKAPTSGEAFSSFLNPSGLLKQFNQKDYKNIFGQSYLTRKRRNEKKLLNLYSSYGEIDAFSIIKLMKDGENICNISINLLHNSFSRRAWVLPHKDLYKGNGRVKHQFYSIQQGPFQCIQIHNYQSSDIHEHSSEDDYNVGGNNHFDIYVFRNSEMFGKGCKPFEIISLKSLGKSKDIDINRLYNEQAKDSIIIEFINFIRGVVKKDDLISNIDSHVIPVKFMSALYESNTHYIKGENPLIKFSL